MQTRNQIGTEMSLSLPFCPMLNNKTLSGQLLKLFSNINSTSKFEQRSSISLDFLVLLTFLSLIIASVSSSCPCGKRRLARIEDKIVGGQLSRQNAWPWTVGLVRIRSGGEKQFCGGSLISSRHVLTAAHCVQELILKNESLANYKVVMGDVRLDGSAVVRHNIESIKVHPSYNSNTLANDIAVMRLSSKVKYSESIQPICLHQPTGQRLTSELSATVVGWGAVRDGGSTVNFQRQVTLQLISNDVCKGNYRQIGIGITPGNMVCAASKNKDSCSGDSGGPLFLKRKNENSFEQIGIVSFGRRCAQPQFPGVYTKVNGFQTFIQRHAPEAPKC